MSESKKVTIRWLNNGNPFEIPQLTVGIQKKILEFQVEHAEEYAQANRDKAEGKLDTPTVIKSQKLDFELQEIIIYESLKKIFPDITLQMIEDNMTIEEIVSISTAMINRTSDLMQTSGGQVKVPLPPRNSKPKEKTS